MAISADNQPHYTTLADFISGSTEAITKLFTQVILICDAEGLIGKGLFAVDACKLLSNASKEWSGSHADLLKKQQKIDRAVRYLLEQHQQADRHLLEADEQQRLERQVEKLKATSRKIKTFLSTTEERRSVSGRIVKSNITDNNSAKMTKLSGTILNSTAGPKGES